MKYRLLIIGLIVFHFSCTPRTSKKIDVSINTKSNTVLTENKIDSIEKTTKENTDTLTGYKKYNSEYDYYLDIYKQEKLIAADDILMLSITDSLFTRDKGNELFYFIVFTKSMNGSDGFYSEAVGLSCFNFITTNPIRFAKYFLSEKKLNGNDFKNWADYIYGEIQISRENQEQEAINELEESLKEKVKDSKKEYKELIDKLIDEIKTAHNSRS